jgi:hypothetical protein
MIVWKHQRHVEADRRFGGEEIDGFRARGKERIDPRRIEIVASLVPASGASWIPNACASDVPGIQSQPPERAVVPPKRGSFSTINTSRPRCRAVTAAAIPAAPDPTTSTSHS